ncbi:hypothetical protein CQ052_12545 [Ochrobactrum sp. MYb15]|uniref:hypothetical protein n=1 Tax=Brucella TaxID=234 RepID=UPI0004656E51|nr:hypothetical protein [Brucella rhizosphaerae]PQZ50110.1 hypothetical protein CQZ90_05670 [Ochrobactrum sp. MYb19]PRA68151.1 hypothetical protein CQ053_00660 [Ochrobactrum sp. MYb18]PRA74621.1 hypothetical protein CQ049_15420 [Brucella thiophenivorans]PRA90402.1 hypothetical protein CQ051_10565 [Ochrobactrum sp. MYb14]PRA95853.1 hypothetical protein CQ052_12545 [Ochrobactrum sp. MYb15]
MLRILSEEIAVNLKDRLREVRCMIRRNRHESLQGEQASSRPGEIVSPELLLGHAASMMDKALTTAETISISLISSNPNVHNSAPHVRSLSVYFGAGAEGARAFRKDMYYLTKEVLRRHQLQNVLIQEAVFVTVHARVMRKHGALLKGVFAAEAGDKKVAETAKAITAMFLELLAEKPVRFISLDGHCDPQALRKFETMCFAAVGLACGLATAKAGDLEGVDPLESAILALDARHERLMQAAEDRDQSQLENLFQTFIAHLP